MPRFYFDVREGANLIPDEKGMELDGVDEAEHEAAGTAAAIGRDKLPSGAARDIGIEVRDERRQMVLAVMVSMRVKRMAPAN